MSSPEQYDLIGYLLGALEPAEQRQVEAALEDDLQLRERLQDLAQELTLFDEIREPTRIPIGLAGRTCDALDQLIDANSNEGEQNKLSDDGFESNQLNKATACRTAKSPTVAKSSTNHRSVPSKRRASTDRQKSRFSISGSSWSATELTIMAAICLVMGSLFFPAIANSRHQARIIACQGNLREIGRGLNAFADLNQGMFPPVPESGNLSVAGSYGPRLLEMGLLEDGGKLICPSSDLAEESDSFELPTWEELEAMTKDVAWEWQNRIGGSYAYSMGFLSNGRYQPHYTKGRPNFVVLADAPNMTTMAQSSRNHGQQGQNVMCEDFSIRYVRGCQLTGCDTSPSGDSFFVNRLGIVAAGVDENDAVVGPSNASPVASVFATAQ